MKKYSPKTEITLGMILFVFFTILLEGYGMLLVIILLIYSHLVISLFCSKNILLKTAGLILYPALLFMLFLPKQIKVGLNELADKNT